MNVLVDIDNVLTDEQFEMISRLIYRHCGINLHDGKKALVRARLAKRLRASRFDNVAEYLDYACSQDGADEFVNLVDSISTNLTSFFREKMHFDYVSNKCLPRLIQSQPKTSSPKVRAWSAGCSTGEEAYSLAITLLEGLPGFSEWDIKILANDISTQVLEQARTGVYDQERVAPLSVGQLNRFFTFSRVPGNKQYTVGAQLRNITRFRYLNLMEEWPFDGRFDLIFCRNVMIYFDKPTQNRLINKFYDHLASGGILCIGHSESLTGIMHKLRYVQPAIYMKA